jgi:hypothetical protein
MSCYVLVYTKILLYFKLLYFGVHQNTHRRQLLAMYGPFARPVPTSQTIVVANGHGLQSGRHVVPNGVYGFAEYRTNGNELYDPPNLFNPNTPSVPPPGVWWDGYRPTRHSPY